MKGRAKRVIAAALEVSGLLSAFEWLDRQPPNTLYVLSYHRVDWPEHRERMLDPDLLSATPDEFARQMRLVSKQCCPISADRLVEAVTGGRPLPRRAILVTFDDAYRDFAENAWPVLKREGIPAILFVSTAYPGDPECTFWWDALHQMLLETDSPEVTLPGIGTLGLDGVEVRRATRERLRSYLAGLGCDERKACLEQLQRDLGVTPERRDSLLAWEDLSRLTDDGLAVAPHTHSHTILACLPAEQVAHEVQTSQLRIRQQLGQDWPIFCYPNGRFGTFNRDTSHILKENGYVAAFTMVCGVNFVGRTPPLEMHRIGIDYQDSSPVLHLRLAALHRYKRSPRQTQRVGALEVA